MKRDEFNRKDQLYRALLARRAQTGAQLQQQLSELARRRSDMAERLEKVQSELEQESAYRRTGELDPVLLTMASERAGYLKEQREALQKEKNQVGLKMSRVNDQMMVNRSRKQGLERRQSELKRSRRAAVGFSEALVIDELSRLGHQGENL